MRGRRKSKFGSDWWETASNSGRVNWPVVIEPTRQPYVSIFDFPDLQTLALERAQLEAIKRPGSVGLLHGLRLRLCSASIQLVKVWLSTLNQT
jgi:hypothetical protein